VIEHVWSVLCQNSAVDNETGSVSLLNVLETITILGEARGEIKLHVNHEVFSEWVRTDEKLPAKGMMRLSFCNTENECKQKLELPVDLSEQVFARTRIKLSGLTISGPGRYKFIVELKLEGSDRWELKVTLPLMVVFNSETK
jgi:hypothetical protein